jgi:hypothetical protein
MRGLSDVMERSHAVIQLSGNTHTMRTLLSMMSFLLLMMPGAYAQDDPTTTMDALVTVRIDGWDEAQWARINAQVVKEGNMYVEYYCLRTGVLVLRIQPVQANEKADVMAIVKRLLRDAGWKGPVEFLDVHVQQHGGSKC